MLEEGEFGFTCSFEFLEDMMSKKRKVPLRSHIEQFPNGDSLKVDAYPRASLVVFKYKQHKED